MRLKTKLVFATFALTLFGSMSHAFAWKCSYLDPNCTTPDIVPPELTAFFASMSAGIPDFALDTDDAAPAHKKKPRHLSTR